MRGDVRELHLASLHCTQHRRLLLGLLRNAFPRCKTIQISQTRRAAQRQTSCSFELSRCTHYLSPLLSGSCPESIELPRAMFSQRVEERERERREDAFGERKQLSSRRKRMPRSRRMLPDDLFWGTRRLMTKVGVTHSEKSDGASGDGFAAEGSESGAGQSSDETCALRESKRRADGFCRLYGSGATGTKAEL